jgi:ribonucleoside-diphosphate reductase alpha chain
VQHIEISQERIDRLNEDIKLFPQVHLITPDMHITQKGVSRLVLLDRYTFKDIELKTLKTGDLVILEVKPDPNFPAMGFGTVFKIEGDVLTIDVDPEFLGLLDNPEESQTGRVTRLKSEIEKPLELFYEQIAKRNATGLAAVEKTEAKRKYWFEKFYKELKALNFIPAGRVLYGAGAETDVTYFNCYVMPFVHDSREGIADHRKQVTEIMSRGGGVGTNGSTLRPKNSLARGVNGRSSGAVSWLDDIAKLTHLVEQGGSRRGAQMSMLADWHPDVIEFIISKMQNPKILRFLIENTEDYQIKKLAQEKLKFTPLTDKERVIFSSFVHMAEEFDATDTEAYRHAVEKLTDGGTFSVTNPDFLTGANISVCLTKEFMAAVKADADYELRFPDVDDYSPEEKKIYNEEWHKCGDVREWEAKGMRVKTYRTIRAKELWQLINTCATYAAEPGIFFIDNANDKTNARAYGQKVVATNPCGEQPLAPFSVCNLAAVNLAEMADKENKVVDWEKLKETVRIGVRMQDNVIDATPYFLEANKTQALGERRVGLGVMGLHDLLIYCETVYGSEEGNRLVDKIFETIAVTAYEASIEIAKEKGSFPFLDSEDGVEVKRLRNAFINTGYMKDMPEYIRQDILENGIRNSHLLTVAPTGSTGTMAGVSTGLEPYFSFSYFRSGRLGKFIEVNADIVQEYLDAHPEADKDNLPAWFISAMELSPEQHADTQCVIQRWVDSSLSKTVNAPKGYTVEQVQQVYERLHKGGAKGGTVYVDGSRDAQVLTLKAEENDLSDVSIEVKKVENEVKERGIKEEEKKKKLGTDLGDTCPICQNGTVIEAGGCHTCDGCGAQLRCGL